MLDKRQGLGFNSLMKFRTNLKYQLSGILKKVNLEKLLFRIFRLINEKSYIFATYDIFYSCASQPSLLREKRPNGIIVQGPIVPGKTLEICSYYSKDHPETKVVLSSWDDEDVKAFAEIKAKNFSIVLSKKPDVSGVANVNLQIVSSSAGIKELAEYGCTHILKTRTDTLLSNQNLINYLEHRLGQGSYNSLLFSSFNSFLFRLYSPSDQVVYGSVENLTHYFDKPFDLPQDSSQFAEKLLFINYLRQFDFDCQENLKQSLVALRDFAVIADHHHLGQIWNKGSYSSLAYRWRGTSFPNKMSQIESWHWDIMQTDLNYFEKSLQSLDL